VDSGERWSGGNVTMLHPGNTPLPITSTGIWDGKAANARLWVVEEWIPLRRTTLLTGDGGSGKSLVSQQIATCVALGLPFMGLKTRKLKALYITCEDDLGELHRRQEGICGAVGASMSELDGNLFFLSRCGDLNNSLLHFHNDGVEQSQFYRDIANFVWTNQIGFLVLDNIAHLFEGNENLRNNVAIFCNAMEALAKEAGATVLFLGHPAKAVGSQYSGSTAWENQVRSRLYLKRPEGDEGAYDDDARILERSKSNYAKNGDAIKFRWQDWAFVEAEAPSATWQDQMAGNAQAAAENTRFMALLQERIKQGRAVSGRNMARNYAPRQFATMPQAKGMKAEQFERAMERLFALEHIEEVDIRNPTDRHATRCIMPVKDAAGHLRATSGGRLSSMRATSQNSRETAENDCGPRLAGHLAGQLFTPGADMPETSGNAGSNSAGHLRGSYGASGGQGSPPIGGLPQPPIPEAGDIIWDSADDEEGQ
jgi:RecA-family ATPase